MIKATSQGYSILELSIVLSILSVILLLFLPLGQMLVAKQQAILFLKEITHDLNLAANEARSKMVNVRLDIFRQQGFYLITIDGVQKKKVQAPTRLSMKSNFPRDRIEFYQNGQISRAGTIEVIDRNGKGFSIVLQLSSGRFIVRRVDP